jgi:hypothetical protein
VALPGLGAAASRIVLNAIVDLVRAGELWVIYADSSEPRLIAAAEADQWDIAVEDVA